LKIHLKHKIIREPFDVALDCLVQDLGSNPIEFRKVIVQHDLLSTDQKNALFNYFDRNEGTLVGHRPAPFLAYETLDASEKLNLGFWTEGDFYGVGGRRNAGVAALQIYHLRSFAHFRTGVFSPFRMDSLMPGIESR